MRKAWLMAVTLFAAPAAAVEPDDPEIIVDPDADAEVEVIPEEEPEVIIVEDEKAKDEGPGASLSAGGGVFGFAEENARDATTDVGAAYSARLHLGTNSPLGFELAYIGT